MSDLIIHKNWLSNHDELFKLLLDETFNKLKTQKGWPSRPDPGHRLGRFGDKDITYTYKDKSKPVNPWTKTTKFIADQVEQFVGWHPNCVVINTYEPASSLYPHCDSKYIPELASDGMIVSVSLGTARTFQIYELSAKGKRVLPPKSYLLEAGDLAIMTGEFDKAHHHGIPAEPEAAGLRLSLTFRKH